jgi:hypothetical protein
MANPIGKLAQIMRNFGALLVEHLRLAMAGWLDAGHTGGG